jgi:hypothetical protein
LEKLDEDFKKGSSSQVIAKTPSEKGLLAGRHPDA